MCTAYNLLLFFQFSFVGSEFFCGKYLAGRAEESTSKTRREKGSNTDKTTWYESNTYVCISKFVPSRFLLNLIMKWSSNRISNVR